jgi:hypothetical protein
VINGVFMRITPGSIIGLAKISDLIPDSGPCSASINQGSS